MALIGFIFCVVVGLCFIGAALSALWTSLVWQRDLLGLWTISLVLALLGSGVLYFACVHAPFYVTFY